MSQASPAALNSEKRPRKPRSPRRSASGARSGPATTKWSAIQKRAASVIDSIGEVPCNRRAVRVYRARGRLAMHFSPLHGGGVSFDKLGVKCNENGIF